MLNSFKPYGRHYERINVYSFIKVFAVSLKSVYKGGVGLPIALLVYLRYDLFNYNKCIPKEVHLYSIDQCENSLFFTQIQPSNPG